MLVALDAFVVLLALLLSAWLHERLRAVVPLLRTPPSLDHYAVLALLVFPLYQALLSVFGLQRMYERAWSHLQLLISLVQLHLVALFALSVLVFLTQTILNRSLAALFLMCTFALLYAERALLGHWRRFQYASGQARERLLLVGAASPELETFVTRALRAPMPPLLLGRLGEEVESSAEEAGSLPVIGTVDDLDEVLHREVVDRVLFFPPLHRPALAVSALDSCETVGVPAHFIVEMPRRSLAAPHVVPLFEHPFVSFDVSPKSPTALAIKYSVDFVLAALGLLVCLPILLLVALAILVTMGRPILFIQDRAGLHGRKFRLLKFRTMQANAEAQRDALLAQNEMSGPVFKIARDPRITPLGRWLRKTSLDELPQLLNVLTGTLSLVGPRPLPVGEQAGIRGWHRRRLSMKPGITGLWQVSGRSNVDFEEWMRLDLQYVDEWSLILDAEILARTLPAVLFGRGAR